MTNETNNRTAAIDPIDELMPFAELLEMNEEELLEDRLKKMYIAQAEEDAKSEEIMTGNVLGNDDSREESAAIPPQNRLPEVPRVELDQDPDMRKSDPEIDPYVHPYYKFGDMLWYSKPIKDGEMLVPLATFTPRLMTENIIHNTQEQKRV